MTQELRHRHLRYALQLVLALAGMACEAKDSSSEPKADLSAANATAVSEPDTDSHAAASVDQGLMDEVMAIANACSLNAGGALVCTSTEPRLQMAREFNEGTRDRAKALPTLAALLAKNEPVVNIVVSELLATGFSLGLGDGARPGDVDSQVTAALIEAYRRFDAYRAHRIVPATTHAAVLSGDAQAWHATLSEKKDLQGIYRMLRHLMIHSRLTMLPQVKVALGDTENLALSMAAIEAMRYMPHWTAEEQRVLCPIVRDKLAGPAGPKAVRAAQTSLHCRGEQFGTVLDTLTTRLQADELKDVELVALFDRCRTPHPIYTQPHIDGVVAEDCRRTLSFLEALAADRKRPLALRSKAVDALGTQVPPAPQVEASVVLTAVEGARRRYAKDKHPPLRAAAERLGTILADHAAQAAKAAGAAAGSKTATATRPSR